MINILPVTRLDDMKVAIELADPYVVPGNKVATLHISKVIGNSPDKVLLVRDIIYNFQTTDPLWT